MRELQLAVKDPARAAQAYYLLGNIYRSEGRFDQAAVQYNRALENNPGELSRAVHFNLGTTCEAQGDVKKAIKIYEGILQEDIDFGSLKRRVKWLKATNLLSMRSRPLQAAISSYGKKDIIALWGREEKNSSRSSRRDEVSVSFGQEHNQAGFDYYLKGMYQAAEEELSLAVQLDPHFGTALNNLGVCLAKAGRFEEARMRLTEAVQLDPASAIFYNNLGVIFLLLDKIEPAKTALEKSYALDFESSAACINLGDVYYLLGKIEKAVELYRKVGAFDPLSDIVERRFLYKIPAPAAGNG
jgi:Flp pilus assembly protein TadD